MPIGNLTSQIFANIYLNEFDRFVKHELRCKRYLRYGDDFIIIEPDLQKLHFLRAQAVAFLQNDLNLRMNPRSDKILKVHHGLKFLGVTMWPRGRRLKKRNVRRLAARLNSGNTASYRGLIMNHGSKRLVRYFHWLIEQTIL